MAAAKADVGEGNWFKLVAQLPFGERAARCLLAIGGDEGLLGADPWSAVAAVLAHPL